MAQEGAHDNSGDSSRRSNRTTDGPRVESVGASVNAWSAEYIDDLHRRWREDPESVDSQWRQFFMGFELAMSRQTARSDASVRTGAGDGGVPRPPGGPGGLRSADSAIQIAHSAQARVDSLMYHYRDIGHFAASLDPLGNERAFPAQLTLDSFSLGDADLEAEFDPGILPLDNPAPLSEILSLLEDTYCRSIGVEYMHIQDRDRRRWLQRRMEGSRNHPPRSPESRIHLLRQLIRADSFESFLKNRYVGKKRFGLEGGESLIVMLDQLLELAPANGVREFAMGMPHRGRLNVLVNIINKSYGEIFTEFEEAWTEGFVEGGGDVKYHQGYSGDRVTTGGETVHLTLAANPSHLEFITAVVLGRARAKQRLRNDHLRQEVVPVILHGDAAFPGQGVVAECLNLMRLDGYAVGGTIHIVVNNQIGFTTNPSDGFTGHYCTDIAKFVDAPIFHVNGDDPEACAWVARLALEYRQAFKNDVVIDMWCYRRHGHNETDEPSFTQPMMYQRIKNQPSVMRRYAERLIDDGVVTEDRVTQMYDEATATMDAAQDAMKQTPKPPARDPFSGEWSGVQAGYSHDPVDTAVSRDQLERLGRALADLPEGFTPHKTVARILKYRGNAVAEDQRVDWALAEMLGYATLLAEGVPIRLTGQDVERGTFSHRHAVVFDQTTGRGHTALDNLAKAAVDGDLGGAARFCVHNSPLTEAACVGFEYGYSLTDPHMLIVWEAQFGDFANGAQVIVDQFIASAETKWRRHSGLVLLLPHGYEGQGPEHSSARLERFLALCANGNMQVTYPTTAAQLFHLLRRQLHSSYRKPLVIMTPKSMLRLAAATSSVSELTTGTFRMVIDDADVEPAAVRRVLLCTGKIAHELRSHREQTGRQDVAIIRIEQLYPFPQDELEAALARYRSAEEIVWVQEEPRNMGAWRFMEVFLRERLDIEPQSICRPGSASPAVGSLRMHLQQQEKIMVEAIGLKTVDADGDHDGKSASSATNVSPEASGKRQADRDSAGAGAASGDQSDGHESNGHESNGPKSNGPKSNGPKSNGDETDQRDVGGTTNNGAVKSSVASEGDQVDGESEDRPDDASDSEGDPDAAPKRAVGGR